MRLCATSKASDQPAHMRSLIRAFASRLNKLLTKQHFEFLSLTGGGSGSSESIRSESTHVKIPHCWKSPRKSHVMALICIEGGNY